MERLAGLIRARRLTAAAAAAVACAVIAPLATAGVTPWAGTGTAIGVACDSLKGPTQALKAFNDTSYYVAAPNGGLESGSTGWTLAGGAAVVSGNETFFANSRKDKSSLSIPKGAAATTPALCVGVEYPYSRLFVKGAAGSSLGVDLLYVDYNGVAGSFRIANVSGTGSWALSTKLFTVSFLLAPFSDLSIPGTEKLGTTKLSAVAYRFTTTGGTWQIDDLYVDPFKLG
jgi:hypothetical protein